MFLLENSTGTSAVASSLVSNINITSLFNIILPFIPFVVSIILFVFIYHIFHEIRVFWKGY